MNNSELIERYSDTMGLTREGAVRRIHALLAALKALTAERDALREALTPSGDTKAAYMGEFAFNIADTVFDEDDEMFIDQQRKVYVPWTTIKEIMAAILNRTALEQDHGR